MKFFTTVLFLTMTLSCTIAQTNFIDNYLSGTINYTNIAGSAQQISQPRDLDFKPNSNELWVVLRGAASGSPTIILPNAGLSNQTAYYRKDSHVSHFMVYCTAIAMAEDGTFGCISEIQNTNSSSPTFMGPSLLSTDTGVYAKVFQSNWASGKPLGSHLDMLHQSPYGMGIAYDNGRQFWVFDGYNGNICKYDFNVDHGPGYDDHSNGELWRYTGVTVTRVANIPSHMVVDQANSWLYFIDGGSKTLKRLKTTSGTVGSNLSVPSSGAEPLALYKAVTGAQVETIETFSTQPCGVEYFNNRLIVSDYTNGNITIYNTTTTPLTKLGTISTGQAGILGVKVGPDGKIWFVNNTANTVVRMDPSNLSADDAAIVEITSPTLTDMETHYYSPRMNLCSSTVAPTVTLKNAGSNTLTSVTINYKLDNGTPATFNWTGSLASGATASVTLPGVAVSAGAHKLTVYTSQPNGNADANPGNNTKSGSFRALDTRQIPFSEGFSSTTWPPAGWDYMGIGNYESYMMHVPNVGGFGNNTGCVKMDNFTSNVDITGQIDYLITPRIDLTSAPASGTVLEFSVAYRQYDASTNDELQVLASTDCGLTWTSIYKKSGSALSTAAASTSAFNTPTSTQWRKESVSLNSYVGQNVVFLFRHLSNYGNNVFIDDVTVTNPFLGTDEPSDKGINMVVYPNPAIDFITLEAENGFLNGATITVVNLIGESVKSSRSDAQYAQLNISGLQNGIYFITVENKQGKATRKLIVNR